MSENQDSLLRAAIEFDGYDLAANHNGMLSERQYDLLWEKRLKDAATAAIPIPLFVIPLVFIWQALSFMPGLFLLSTVLEAILFLFVLGIIIFYLRYSIRTWRRYSLDLRNRHIEAVEGRVMQNPKQRGRYISYSIVVAGREFTVSGRIMLAFQNGAAYRVYFAPESATVVSAEWIA